MPTFKELTGLDPVKPTDVRPFDAILRGSSADQRRAAGEAAIELDESTSLGDLFSAAWQTNITNNLYDTVQRKYTHEPQDTFDPTEWVTENKDTLPGVNLGEFASVRSPEEANELRDDMLRADQNQRIAQAAGYGGIAAQMLVGIVDPVELAAGIATGGSSKGATLFGKLAKGAGQGTAGGVIAGGLNYTVDPLADTKQVVFGALTGALLGTTGSAVAHRLNRASRATRDDFPEEVDDLPDASTVHSDTPVFEPAPAAAEGRAPVAFNVEDLQPTNQSLGAASFLNPIDVALMNPEHTAIWQQAVTFSQQHSIAQRLDDVEFPDNAAGRTARRFSNALADSDYMPEAIKIDFDRMAYGGSSIEQTLAYNLLESPEGRVRNNRTAAILQDIYEKRLASRSMPVIEENWVLWADQNNVGKLARQKAKARELFDRQIIEELEARFHEGKRVSVDPLIKNTADAVDTNYAEALTIAKGRPGETAVSGFEDIQPKSGFFNHIWSGKAVRRVMAKGISRDRIEALLRDGYKKTYPEMDEAQSTMLSKAVVTRAIAKGDGIDTNMLNTLDQDGQDFLRELLTNGGYDQDAIDSLITTLRGNKETKSQLGTTKARVQVDLRTTDGEFSLMDLVDTNLNRVLSQYNRTVSGQSALARKGIANRKQRKDMIDAAMAERRARGLPAGRDQRTFLEDVFTHFDSGPIAGGVSPVVSRAKRLTNLALLNQMGITQAGETGAQIAAVGMETWQKHAKVVYKEMARGGPESPIIKELRPLMGRIGEDHLLYRDDLQLDELSSTKELNTWMGKFDYALGKGQRAQGYISGFYYVKGQQQKVAVASMADKVFQRLRDGIDEAELRDIGIDPSIKQYIDDGTVTFAPDGFVDKLNIALWDEVDAEDFTIALNRHTHQVVQKSLAGEDGVWMHKDVGSLLTHLKSFPLLAMRKQATRTAGVSSPLAIATLTWGLATAGVAQQAKQIINGKPENVGPTEALKGAMAMSNMTGWVPMLTDPAAAIMGMDELKISQYGRHNIDTGVLSAPPTLTTLNKMMQLPGAVNPLGDLSPNERIRILQTTPLVGNLYGFAALFNSMKD